MGYLGLKSGRSRTLAAASLLLLLLFLFSVRAQAVPPGPPSVVTIPIGSGNNLIGPGYSPASITVVMGVNNTVLWKNNDNTTHTATSDNGLFDSGTLNPGQTYTVTFNNTGSFAYHCTFHTPMHGSVTVKAASAVPEFPMGWLAAIFLVSMVAAVGATRLRRPASTLKSQ